MKLIIISTLVMAALRTPEPLPMPIVQGHDASSCQWPSVVALRTADNNMFCTGTLVHPRLVLTAGHCVEPTTGLIPSTVAFGEDAATPAATALVESCTWHPDYAFVSGPNVQEASNDVAYCVLTAPADGVPIVPVAMGCEADAQQLAADATIVGFGASAGGVMDGAPWAEGVGRKRWTDQTIVGIDAAKGKATVAGAAGNSACLGDSGGPLFMQVADGSWRLFGVASAAMLDAEQECGLGAIYQRVAEHVAWIEQDAGVDLSACFDDAGAWAPTEACGEFPLAPAGTDAVWDDTCAAGERGGFSASCGSPFDAGSAESGSSSSGASPESSDDAADATSVGEGTAGGGSSSDDGSSSGAPLGADAPGDEGCGCTASQTGHGAGFAGLAMLVLGVRRRARDREARAVAVTVVG